jgi:hypothetical protein
MQTPSETELGFPAKGSLKRVPFSSLLREIAGAKITGSLYLLSGDTKKVVFFVDGRPTVVRSNLATEFLGQILTDLGMITQEQCDNTLEAIRRTGKKQGELLVEMGILSEGNLRYVLEEQLRNKLYEIFTWEEGRFQFKVGAEPGNAGTPPALSTEALIITAVQDRFADERAREALKAWSDKYPAQNSKWTGDPAALDLLPEELYFLRCLDGSRTTDELLSRKPDLEVPQISTLLLGLIHAGVVEPLDAKLPRRLPPPRPNLAPPILSEEQLAPKFEPASTIGEYEDTPLPSHLPDLGVSSSKNPRVPILPTEDEEMFRGLNVDESIVTDTRKIAGAAAAVAALAAAKPKLGAREPTPIPAPAPALGQDDESDFSDLRADSLSDDDDVKAPVPAASPKLDSGKHKLGPPPGLANLLRKDTPRPAPAPTATVTPPEKTPAPLPAAAPLAAVAAAALADDDLGDMPDDLPDLGDEEIEEIEELDELDAGDDLEDAGDELGAAGDEDEGLPPEDEDDDDGAALARARTPTLPPEDEPEEPADLGDLSGDAALPDVDAGDSGLLADVGDLDDDLLLSGDDGELPDLGDLDDVDLAADGELGDDADLGDADLGDDADLDAGSDLGDAGDDGELGDAGDFGDDGGFTSAENTFVGGDLGDGGGDGMDAYGAQRYAEAESAMREGDYDTAVALFEDAYNAGLDVAELHAHLAFARYRASGGDPDIGQNSLELLDYAESLDPGLAMLHAYRGAILVGLGATEQARECFERALYLDPYNELALEYRDSV